MNMSYEKILHSGTTEEKWEKKKRDLRLERRKKGSNQKPSLQLTSLELQEFVEI
jgi:hypothetical protein